MGPNIQTKEPLNMFYVLDDRESVKIVRAPSQQLAKPLNSFIECDEFDNDYDAMEKAEELCRKHQLDYYYDSYYDRLIYCIWRLREPIEYESLSPESKASLERGLQDAREGRVSAWLDENGKPIDFSKYLDDDEKRQLSTEAILPEAAIEEVQDYD